MYHLGDETLFMKRYNNINTKFDFHLKEAAAAFKASISLTHKKVRELKLACFDVDSLDLALSHI